MSSDAYKGAISDGLDEVRKWMANGGVLPESCWDLPKDCPIWSMGLSAAQAQGIVNALRTEASGGPKARP